MLTKTTNFARLTHEERMVWLGSRVIMTSDVQKVMLQCERLYRQAGTKSEGNGAFIIGDTGAGKSTAVSAFVDKLFERLKSERPQAEWLRPKVPDTVIRPIIEVNSETGYKRPVMVIVVPPRPRFNSFARIVGAALGIDLSTKLQFGDAFDQVKLQLQEQGTKMIIFDEVQHFVDATANSYQAADVLKVLIKCQVQVVCIGIA